MSENWHPYELPNRPHVTVRLVLVWIVKSVKGGEGLSAREVSDRFRITPEYAGVIVMKLHRWGYLRRTKSPVPPKVYRYTPTAFGLKTAKRWSK